MRGVKMKKAWQCGVFRCEVARVLVLFFLFFFNDTATTEIYTLSLHDALPIFFRRSRCHSIWHPAPRWARRGDRKSTRLNSSHQIISYAVFCLKKKKPTTIIRTTAAQRTTNINESRLYTTSLRYSRASTTNIQR